ncbi:YggS family pyridoxal phosphate-dependent enzyme [Kouleothrix sp.]|uniref:YggS family pyridoxal phosphate-dependent enzyme n=1 Tax=Kouleothrix sp. TaxID=2779161 RepID=UPI00391B928E
MESVAARIAAIHERIAAAARRSGRAPEQVRLVGVSKTHPPERVAEALAAGLRDFGENRVQEAEAKIAALAAERAQLTWHLIGHLQSNKARRAAALFDCVHSVDSLHLARALARGAAGREPGAAGRGPLAVLLQVNISGEASKEGFDLAGWDRDGARLGAFLAEVEQLLALPALAVQGLMTIAPWGSDAEQARPVFDATRRLRDELARRFGGAWPALSMGMTDDFEVAIDEGATLVRVGRAIFGAR